MASFPGAWYAVITAGSAGRPAGGIPKINILLHGREQDAMMKKSRLTRLFSLFTTVLMGVSLVPAAFAEMV